MRQEILLRHASVVVTLLQFHEIFSKYSSFYSDRAQPEWVNEFPDRTGPDPKFARQVLPDQIEFGLIFSNMLPNKYGL